MRRYLPSLLAAMLALVACNGNAPSAQVAPQASITLDIGVPDDRRDAFVAALRLAIANGLGNGSVSVNMDSYGSSYYQMNQPTTTVAGVDLYTSALDDAHRKAAAVAERLHVSLAAPNSVSEELQSFPIGQALKGGTQASTVRVLPNQPIILYVSFATSIPGQTITVFGISSSETTQPNGGPKLDDVRVQITGRGKDVKAAGDAVSQVEGKVRDEASKFGILASSMHVTGTNFSQP